MRKKLILLIIALALVVGFAPPFQGVQRFTTIVAQKLTVSTSATIQDATITNVTLAGTVTSSGPVVGSAGGSFSPNIVVAAPTAIAAKKKKSLHIGI